MRLALAVLALLVAAPLVAQGPRPGAAATTAVDDATPPIVREFRGVWVAAVGNMDWPSRRGLPTAEQQRELLDILDRAQALRLNAVILQVRPSGDALYASKLEPWSEYLTGEQGLAPEPFWDPLAFAVEEAHRRGLELHAWFNPYRAKDPTSRSATSAKHLMRRRPDLARSYGPYKWFDPGVAEVRGHFLRVVLDVVKRYDVDAVHIDDYFYPYREASRRGGYLEFPDARTYRVYRRGGGTLSRDDWRRRNVDLLIEELYASVKREKPWVKVGLSPFGIWRPGHPPMVRGLDAYQEIYADARKWANRGWADYLAPQLYWKADAPQQPYDALLQWWVEQNAKGRHIWPGLFTSRAGNVFTAGEILEEVRRTRDNSGASGNVHFSMKALLDDQDGVASRLSSTLYLEPALVPASPWLDSTPPAAPVARAEADPLTGRTTVTMRPTGSGAVRLWVVQARAAGRWTTRILPGAERRAVLAFADASAVPDRVIVRAIDRVGNESKPVEVDLPRAATGGGSR